MKQTHEILRELRESHNYTQTYIADYLGITQQTYSYYELGQHEIPLHHLVKLSHLYKVSVDYMLGIHSPYTGSTDLTQEFLAGTSLHDIVSDLQKMDDEKRKSLAQFVRFLNSLE